MSRFTRRIQRTQHTSPSVPVEEPFVRGTSEAHGYGASTLVVPKPAGALEGDVLVGFLTSHSENPERLSPPSGWTLLEIFTRPGNSMSTFYKVVGPSEPADWTFTVSTGSDTIVMVTAVANVDASEPPRYVIGMSEAHEAPSVTPFTSSDMLLCAVGTLLGEPGGLTGEWVAPSGMTKLMDTIHSDGGYSAQAVASQLLTSASPTGPRTFDNSGHSVRHEAQVASVVLKGYGEVGNPEEPEDPTAPFDPQNRRSMAGLSIPFLQLDTLEKVNATFERLIDLNVGWLRTDLPPYVIWTQSGAQNISWTAADRIVTRAQQANIKVLFVVSTLPAWLGHNNWQKGPETATERNAYVDFFERAVQRYNTNNPGVVKAWEMWNEPNWEPFWQPTPSASLYRDMVAQTYATIKPQLDEGVPLIAGGPTGTDSSTWFNQLYTIGAQQYWDAVAIHPYQDHNYARNGQYYSGGTAGQVTPTRQIMNQHGDTDAVIWNTEMGNPTTYGSYVATEAEQAAWLTPTLNQWVDQNTSRGKTGPVFWYSLFDQQTGAPERESNYGIVQTNGTVKPAYTAFKNWIAG